MTRVRISQQVESYVKSLAPEPRRRLRAAIKSLADGRGDVLPLESDLQGWSRLRVESVRVIFAERFEKGTRLVDCVYCNRRFVVYDLFRELLRHELFQPPSESRRKRH